MDTLYSNLKYNVHVGTSRKMMELLILLKSWGRCCRWLSGNGAVGDSDGFSTSGPTLGEDKTLRVTNIAMDNHHF